MKKTKNSFLNFLKLTYIKIFKINDTPQKIALGTGIGVFSGILPGTGPIAALCLAFIFRVNRAAALIGSLLTNTWLSVVSFLLSIKVGAAVSGVNWQAVRQDWHIFLKEFNWVDLLRLSVLKVILPVALGYFIIAFCSGIVVYLITVVILTRMKYENKSRVDFSR